MEKPNQEKASKLTKILIKKTHGGRKQDSKFWQSESNKKETSPDTPKRGPSKRLQILAFTCGILAGCVIVTVKYGPDFVPSLARSAISNLKSYLPKQENQIEINPDATPLKKIGKIKPKKKNSTYTDEQVRKAMDEVLLEKKHSQSTSLGRSQRVPESSNKYEYEIELYSGGKIYTDNAKIIGDQITYTGRNGLVVSINKDEIMTMKRIKAND